MLTQRGNGRFDYDASEVMGFEPLQFSLETRPTNSQTSNKVAKFFPLNRNPASESGKAIVARFQRPDFQRNREAFKPEGRLLAGIADNSQDWLDGFACHRKKGGGFRRAEPIERHNGSPPESLAAPVVHGPELRG